MEERRGARRWAVNKDAELQVQDQSNVFPCIVEDLSTSGMRISLGRNLFPEVFSKITLALGDALSFDAGAHVAWQESQDNRNTYGLSFSNIDQGQRNRIERYINNNFTDQILESNNDQWWKGF